MRRQFGAAYDGYVARVGALGCEARAGKGATNRERRPVKLGDLRRGRPSWGPASLMRPTEDRARRNVRVLCRYVADRTEDATVIAAL